MGADAAVVRHVAVTRRTGLRPTAWTGNLARNCMEPAAPLSSRIFQTVREGFFRPLARPSAAIYADCADRLKRGADEGGRLTLDETLVLIRDVLAWHPKTELAPEEGADTQDLRQRAGKFFNQMLEAGWLEERRPSLDEHWVLLSPSLRPMLRMLRELAEDDVAELKDFAATLRAVCVTLLRVRRDVPVGRGGRCAGVLRPAASGEPKAGVRLLRGCGDETGGFDLSRAGARRD